MSNSQPPKSDPWRAGQRRRGPLQARTREYTVTGCTSVSWRVTANDDDTKWFIGNESPDFAASTLLSDAPESGNVKGEGNRLCNTCGTFGPWPHLIAPPDPAAGYFCSAAHRDAWSETHTAAAPARPPLCKTCGHRHDATCGAIACVCAPPKEPKPLGPQPWAYGDAVFKGRETFAEGLEFPTCSAGSACPYHNPKKVEPWVPSVDDFDLLPDL